MNTTPALSLRNIHKSFDGIVAVEDLNLDVKRGEIVALVGDNGAGKSTVVKIVAGMHQPSSGQIRLAGELVHFIDPSQSQAKGIQVVYQDLALAESQPVYMNLFLGREKTKGRFGKLDRADPSGSLAIGTVWYWCSKIPAVNHSINSAESQKLPLPGHPPPIRWT
jgi:ABC-type sugar transport system ATPase subunit